MRALLKGALNKRAIAGLVRFTPARAPCLFSWAVPGKIRERAAQALGVLCLLIRAVCMLAPGLKPPQTQQVPGVVDRGERK